MSAGFAASQEDALVPPVFAGILRAEPVAGSADACPSAAPALGSAHPGCLCLPQLPWLEREAAGSGLPPFKRHLSHVIIPQGPSAVIFNNVNRSRRNEVWAFQPT